MIANCEKSKEEQEATVRMFCTLLLEVPAQCEEGHRPEAGPEGQARPPVLRHAGGRAEPALMPGLRALLRVAVRRGRYGRVGGRPGHRRRHPGLGRGWTGHRPAPLLRRMARRAGSAASSASPGPPSSSAGTLPCGSCGTCWKGGADDDLREPWWPPPMATP